MNFSWKHAAPEQLLPALNKYSSSTARTHNSLRSEKILCVVLAVCLPCAAALAQSSSSSQQSSSSSQQSSTQSQPPSPAQPATLDQSQKQDSLADAARKAKAKKQEAAKGKVYTEEDLAGMKGRGVSVVGEAPKKDVRPGQPMDPNGNGGENNEQYWRGKAREILAAIAATDEQIAEKKDEIKKLGSGGFDVTTGFKNNVAYINDRNGQLTKLEQHKADLQRRLDDLAEEGRKAGAPASWFR